MDCHQVRKKKGHAPWTTDLTSMRNKDLHRIYFRGGELYVCGFDNLYCVLLTIMFLAEYK